MIKMGILSTGNLRSRSIELIQDFNELKITNLSFDADANDQKAIMYNAEDIIDTSDGIYIDIPNPSFDLLKLIIKNSSHIFSHSFPDLTTDETKELINLEKEAGCISHFFNPSIFESETLKLFKQFDHPGLINIRLKPIQNSDLEKQLLNVLLYIVLLDKSEIKKIDLFSVEDNDLSFILDIQFNFSSGSVARLMISPQLKNDLSSIEIFQRNQPVKELELKLPDEKSILASEQNAIKQFIKAIKNQPSIMITLTELLQAKKILAEIKGKLKTRGSLLLQ